LVKFSGKQNLIDFEFGTDAQTPAILNNDPGDLFSLVPPAPLTLASQPRVISPSPGPTSSSQQAGSLSHDFNAGFVPGGGGIALGMSGGLSTELQSPAPRPSSAPSSSSVAPSKGNDPFADLAGLF